MLTPGNLKVMYLRTIWKLSVKSEDGWVPCGDYSTEELAKNKAEFYLSKGKDCRIRQALVK